MSDQKPKPHPIVINPTQQNVLLAAAEVLDDLGSPLNANDIRMILAASTAAQPVDAVTLESALEAIEHLELSNSRGRASDARAMLKAAQPVDTSRKIGASMYSVDFGDERPDRPDSMLDVD